MKTVKDKYDVIGLWSMISISLGFMASVVAFIVNFCNHFVLTYNYETAGVPTSVHVVEISVFTAKTLLLFGLVGGLLYQFLNLKRRDDLAMWYVLIWFEASVVFALFVLYFPGVFQQLLGLIFRG